MVVVVMFMAEPADGCQAKKLVPRGLKPRTLRLLAVRSNQLSYETFCHSLDHSHPTILRKKGKPVGDVGLHVSKCKQVILRSTPS